eukprot:GEMP01088510.1.p1 GENE.GEMP01088510.1~~GEMP01088510.1.p1  ORF type:complete len:225 (+),score=54.51 GEMP01088510.1:278-952(+)
MPLLRVTLRTLMPKRDFELIIVDPLAMDVASLPVCGMIFLTSDFLGVDFDFLRGIAARSVFLAAFGLCADAYWRCEYFFASFHAAVNAACGNHSCLTMLRRDELIDKVIATFPTDCAAFRNLDSAGTLAQWEQDIFVLQHFFPYVPRNLSNDMLLLSPDVTLWLSHTLGLERDLHRTEPDDAWKVSPISPALRVKDELCLEFHAGSVHGLRERFYRGDGPNGHG